MAKYTHRAADTIIWALVAVFTAATVAGVWLYVQRTGEIAPLVIWAIKVSYIGSFGLFVCMVLAFVVRDAIGAGSAPD